MNAQSLPTIVLVLYAAVLASGCSPPIRGAQDLPANDAFVADGCVVILGYDGDAMEPFIEPTRGDLLFNNRNSPPEQTDLHWARKVDDGDFQYVGPIDGANSTALDGVPSIDGAGAIYWVSTRSYAQTLSTLYRGRWSDGAVTQAALVQGLSRERAGFVNFDAEISRDGESLYYVDGRFSGGPVPESADIEIAHRSGDRFVRDADSDVMLASVNTQALEFAPAISADRRELFFTRLDLKARTIAIYRVTRSGAGQPYGPPERIAAANGFVEAPALSADGRTLYFHRLEADRYRICRAVRRLPGQSASR